MTVKHGFFDSDGRLLRELDEAERHAISAIGGQVAKQHTCMIARHQNSGVGIGSGTLVRVGQSVLVATVKHIFRNIEEHETVGLFWGNEDCRAEVTGREIIQHDRLDLAAIRLATEASRGGVALDDLAADDPVSADELFVVSGIPGEKVSIDRRDRTVVIGHWSLGLVRLPERAWPEHTERPMSYDVDMLMNYTKRFALDERGEPMPQIAPFGLSGGGIWSVPIRSDGVWSPTAAKLVAIQSSVEADKWKYLRATKIMHWLRLLASKYPETQSDIRSEFPDVLTKEG